MPMPLTAFPVERAPKPDSSCSLFASSFSLSVFLLSSSPAINSFEALVFPHPSCLALHTSRVSFSKSSWFPNLHLDILLSQQKSQRVKNFSPLEGGNRTQSDPLIALSVSLFLHLTSSASCISPLPFHYTSPPSPPPPNINNNNNNNNNPPLDLDSPLLSPSSFSIYLSLSHPSVVYRPSSIILNDNNSVDFFSVAVAVSYLLAPILRQDRFPPLPPCPAGAASYHQHQHAHRTPFVGKKNIHRLKRKGFSYEKEKKKKAL